MKKITTLALALTVFSSVAQADTIELRADEWCPYNCVPGSDSPGYMVEVAIEAFKEAGHTVNYETLEWTQAIEDTRAGKYDGIIGASIGDAADFVFPKRALGILQTSFITLKDNEWKYEDIKSLEGKKIAVIQDYDYGSQFNTYFEDNSDRVHTATGDTPLANNLKLLVEGKVDMISEDYAVAIHEAKKMGIADKIKLAGSDTTSDIAESSLYIAFSPAKDTSKGYAKILSDGIKKMRSSGKLKEIYQKYGL